MPAGSARTPVSDDKSHNTDLRDVYQELSNAATNYLRRQSSPHSISFSLDSEVFLKKNFHIKKKLYNLFDTPV